MAEDQQNTSDISNQETDKISRVTQEMLDNFAVPKPLEENSEDEIAENDSSENSIESNPEEEINDDNSQTDEEISDEEKPEEEKTVVEFSEDSEVRKEKPKATQKPYFILKILVGFLLVLLTVAAIFGIWNRWFRYDDNAQMISNWQISGTNNIIVIDGKKINLGPNAVLNYTLDEGAKLINYTIGDMSGSSHYRFSWDRNQLAIIENCGVDPISTMLSDLGWFWDYMTCRMGKIDLSPAYTKNNKEEVDTENTGLEDIISNGNSSSILLDKVATKKAEEVQ